MNPMNPHPAPQISVVSDSDSCVSN